MPVRSLHRNPAHRQWRDALLFVCLALAFFWGQLGFAYAEDDDEHNNFGQETASEAALMGIFYDLKMTQDQKPTGVDADSYWHVIDEFLSKGWDESVLNKYYRCTKPVYTTQIFIPTINADTAPKAFNAPKTVKPALWVIHYKAQITPPEAGTYRFVGCSDDFMGVAINGKTCLVSPLFAKSEIVMPKTNWKPMLAHGMQASHDQMCSGDWIEMKSDEIYDLDVLIGERPGGVFNAFLMVEREGGNYTMQYDKYPILPIFQVGAYDTPTAKPDDGPPFAKGFPVWKSFQ